MNGLALTLTHRNRIGTRVHVYLSNHGGTDNRVRLVFEGPTEVRISREPVAAVAPTTAEVPR